MEAMKRYAVYYAPPAGEFADRANAWLGWDAERAAVVVQPDLGLPAADITNDPRKYGFHGTIKPPFRLAEGQSFNLLCDGLGELATKIAPVILPGLRLANIDGFLALIPTGDQGPLLSLGAAVVRGLDGFRAPLTEAEVARRRPERLSPRQRDLLDQWGYPFVMEEFRFHLTLTDRLPDDLAIRAAAILSDHFAPVLPQPFAVADLCLFAEAQDGRFHLLHRYALSG